MSFLELAIIKTLTWFDLFNYPLTVWEVWYYLWSETGGLNKISHGEVLETLEKLARAKKVKNCSGYWQLSASPDYLAERWRRLRWSIKKRRIAACAARVISYLPHVRLVALVNTVAFNAPAPDSDIDFFIIARAGRIFTARFLVTLVMQIFGWRRHGRLINNRICLSFYLADDNLNLYPLAYHDDPYLRFWLAGLDVLYNDGVFHQLVEANRWLGRELPNWLTVANSQLNTAYSSKPLQNSIGESILEKFQMYLIKRHQNSRLGDGTTAVLASRQILKFHEKDVRPELAIKFRQRLAEIMARL